MTNLQVIAKRCPVMSKALAVQSARIGGGMGMGFGVGGQKLRMMHTSKARKARVDTAEVRRENGKRECFCSFLELMVGKNDN